MKYLSTIISALEQLDWTKEDCFHMDDELSYFVVEFPTTPYRREVANYFASNNPEEADIIEEHLKLLPSILMMFYIDHSNKDEYYMSAVMFNLDEALNEREDSDCIECIPKSLQNKIIEGYKTLIGE